MVGLWKNLEFCVRVLTATHQKQEKTWENHRRFFSPNIPFIRWTILFLVGGPANDLIGTRRRKLTEAVLNHQRSAVAMAHVLAQKWFDSETSEELRMILCWWISKHCRHRSKFNTFVWSGPIKHSHQGFVFRWFERVSHVKVGLAECSYSRSCGQLQTFEAPKAYMPTIQEINVSKNQQGW